MNKELLEELIRKVIKEELEKSSEENYKQIDKSKKSDHYFQSEMSILTRFIPYLTKSKIVRTKIIVMYLVLAKYKNN